MKLQVLISLLFLMDHHSTLINIVHFSEAIISYYQVNQSKLDTKESFRPS